MPGLEMAGLGIGQTRFRRRAGGWNDIRPYLPVHKNDYHRQGSTPSRSVKQNSVTSIPHLLPRSPGGILGLQPTNTTPLMDWADEPATEQQVSQLRKLGFVMARPLSLMEAASLIRQYKKQAARRSNPPAPQPQAPAFSSRGGVSPFQLSSQPMQAGWSRRVRETTPTANQTPELGAAVPPPAPSQARVAENELVQAQRVEFWLDTFREVKEMKIGSVKVYELRQKHGCHFLSPGREQVQDILGALDSAMPSWEHEHPEYFFQTLELNFPELVHKAGGGF